VQLGAHARPGGLCGGGEGGAEVLGVEHGALREGWRVERRLGGM